MTAEPTDAHPRRASAPGGPSTESAKDRRRIRTAIVTRKEWLNPDMVRVFFAGSDLLDIDDLTYSDHYVKILFAPEGADYRWPFDPDALRETVPREQWPVTRTYTIRSFDRDTPELAIDFVVHGDSGLAGPWAASAEPGDEIGFRGPGGAYVPEEDYDCHLLVGDEAAIPAIAASLERLPEHATATAILEVADDEHLLPVPENERIKIIWVHRDGQPYGEPLARAVRDHGLPEGRVQAFVHGNAGMIKDLRRWFFVEQQLDRKQVSISGYWRSGLNEDAWQSGKRDFVASMEAEETAALQATR